MAYYKCGRIYTTQNSNVVVDTASGSVANFETDLALPLKSLDVDVNAVQDLHGYDAPWVGGAGKNLCPPVTIGMNYENNTGRVSTSSTQAVSAKFPFDKDKTYTFTKNCDVNFMIFAWDLEGNFVGRTAGANTSPKIFTKDSFSVGSGTRDYDSITQIAIKFYQSSGQDINDVTDAEYQVEEGELATDFEPYENICPITGQDEVNIYHSGEDTSNPDEITITLGQTVYGGTLNVTTGKLKINYSMVNLGSMNWLTTSSPNIFRAYLDGRAINQTTINHDMCENYDFGFIGTTSSLPRLENNKWGYQRTNAFMWIRDDRFDNPNDFKNAVNGVKFVYELATPIEVQLTPQEIETLLGINNIYADTGDTSLQFAKIGN